MRSSDRSTNVQLANDLAWWPGDTGYARHDRNQRGWDTGFFKTSGDQTHGLMTHGSAGHQECGLHSIGLKSCNDVGDCLPDQRLDIGLQTH